MREPCKTCGHKFIYVKDCLECAVRLVKSARPSRKQQEMMLEFLVLYCNQDRDTILEALKNDTKPTVD